MKKNLQIISSAIVMTLFFTFPAFAGQWIQDAGRPAVSDGVSNWRWQEDDGTYVQDCDLWLDGNKDGIYENYYFNSGGWMLAATQNGYGQTINSDGALLNNDGSVFRIIAPKDPIIRSHCRKTGKTISATPFATGTSMWISILLNRS